MHRDEIERHLRQVGRYLDEQQLTGEILIVGGAYMILVPGFCTHARLSSLYLTVPLEY
jgi:hypothetical protein